MQTLHETELSYTQDYKLDLNGMARTLLEDLINTLMVDVIYKATRRLHNNLRVF